MARYCGHSHPSSPRPVPSRSLSEMRVCILLILALATCFWSTSACGPDQSQNGCKIYGTSCLCGYGCKTDYIYRNRRACLDAMRERSSNVCELAPCLRGICTQTVQDPGFACKCEGTGFYGQRCEKACPPVLKQSQELFLHQCIVI